MTMQFIMMDIDDCDNGDEDWGRQSIIVVMTINERHISDGNKLVTKISA